VFHDYGSRGTVSVTENIGLLFANLADVRHDTAVHAHVGNSLWFAIASGAYVQRKIRRVGNEALLAGPDLLEKTFPGEGFLFEDAEAAAIESDSARVGEPEGALRLGKSGALIPDGDFVGGNGGLDDGDEGRPVLQDCDRLFQFVFEEIAEFLCECG
jgi:hypothetical protein